MFVEGTSLNPFWFFGVVVDKDDPTNNGRVRVRTLGMHPEDPRIPVELNDKEELDYVEDKTCRGHGLSTEHLVRCNAYQMKANGY